MATLFHGDCLQVMKDLSANSIDCFICDLPYGCLEVNRKQRDDGITKKYGGGGGCAWDIPLDLPEFWTQVKRLAKDDHTPVLMFCTTRFGNELINSNPKWFRYDLVWDKQRGVSFLSANKMPMRSHEMIYVFSKAGARYERVDISGNFQKWEKDSESRSTAGSFLGSSFKRGSEGGDGKRCALSVIDIKQRASYQMKGQHPTEKPIALYEWLIARYCPKGGTILDPTAGSFNSVQAALNLGRKAIGIEKDPGFYKKACERLQEEKNEIVDGASIAR